MDYGGLSKSVIVRLKSAKARVDLRLDLADSVKSPPKVRLNSGGSWWNFIASEFNFGGLRWSKLEFFETPNTHPVFYTPPMFLPLLMFLPVGMI